MAVDPLVIIIAVFLYIVGTAIMTPVIFVTFVLKAIPIFFETCAQYVQKENVHDWIGFLKSGINDCKKGIIKYRSVFHR